MDKARLVDSLRPVWGARRIVALLVGFAVNAATFLGYVLAWRGVTSVPPAAETAIAIGVGTLALLWVIWTLWRELYDRQSFQRLAHRLLKLNDDVQTYLAELQTPDALSAFTLRPGWTDSRRWEGFVDRAATFAERWPERLREIKHIRGDVMDWRVPTATREDDGIHRRAEVVWRMQRLDTLIWLLIADLPHPLP